MRMLRVLASYPIFSTAVVASLTFAGLGCSTKPIPELKSRTSMYEEIAECREFDRLLKTRLESCNEDTDCYEVAMPRAPECYIPFTGNIAEKEKLEGASRKCDERYLDDKYCEALIPQRPVCKLGRCQLISK